MARLTTGAPKFKPGGGGPGGGGPPKRPVLVGGGLAVNGNQHKPIAGPSRINPNSIISNRPSSTSIGTAPSIRARPTPTPSPSPAPTTSTTSQSQSRPQIVKPLLPTPPSTQLPQPQAQTQAQSGEEDEEDEEVPSRKVIPAVNVNQRRPIQMPSSKSTNPPPISFAPGSRSVQRSVVSNSGSIDGGSQFKKPTAPVAFSAGGSSSRISPLPPSTPAAASASTSGAKSSTTQQQTTSRLSVTPTPSSANPTRQSSQQKTAPTPIKNPVASSSRPPAATPSKKSQSKQPEKSSSTPSNVQKEVVVAPSKPSSSSSTNNQPQSPSSSAAQTKSKSSSSASVDKAPSPPAPTTDPAKAKAQPRPKPQPTQARSQPQKPTEQSISTPSSARSTRASRRALPPIPSFAAETSTPRSRKNQDVEMQDPEESQLERETDVEVDGGMPRRMTRLSLAKDSNGKGGRETDTEMEDQEDEDEERDELEEDNQDELEDEDEDDISLSGNEETDSGSETDAFIPNDKDAIDEDLVGEALEKESRRQKALSAKSGSKSKSTSKAKKPRSSKATPKNKVPKVKKPESKASLFKKLGVPSKPPSSYLLFAAWIRETKGEEFKAKGMSVTDIAKESGQEWKALSEEGKKKWEDEAKEKKEAWLATKKTWDDEHPEALKEIQEFKKNNPRGSGTDDTENESVASKKRRRVKKPQSKSALLRRLGLPSKPPSSYLLFAAWVRETKGEDFKTKGLDVTAVAKETGREWKALTEEEKKKWEDQAKEKKEEWLKLKETWEDENPEAVKELHEFRRKRNSKDSDADDTDEEGLRKKKSRRTSGTPGEPREKRKKRIPLPGEPLKPLPAYLLWSADQRAKHSDEWKEDKITAPELLSVLATKWKETPEEERRPWRQLHDEKVEEFKKIRAQWEEENPNWEEMEGPAKIPQKRGRKPTLRTVSDDEAEYEQWLMEDPSGAMLERTRLDAASATMEELTSLDWRYGRPSTRTFTLERERNSQKEKAAEERAKIRRGEIVVKEPIKGEPKLSTSSSKKQKKNDPDEEEVSDIESLDGEGQIHRRRPVNDDDSLQSASDQEDDDGASVGTANTGSHFQESRTAIMTRIENGKIVIDESSMNVRLGGDDPEEDAGGMEVVDEAERNKFVNSATGAKKKKGDRWTAAETDAFYRVS